MTNVFESPAELDALPEIIRADGMSPQRTIITLGNCQAGPLAKSLEALCGGVVAHAVSLPLSSLEAQLASSDSRLRTHLGRYDHILLQPNVLPLISSHVPELLAKTLLFPMLAFSAYHPDLVYVRIESQDQNLTGPLGHYNSAIALWAFLRGLTVRETVSLFNSDTYEALGYFDYWDPARRAFLREGELAHFPLEGCLERWSRRGCFMHSINHPKLFTVADVAKALLERLGLDSIPGAAEYLFDAHADGPVWPVYPEIAERLGIAGHYFFKIERGLAPPDRPVAMLGLEEFVDKSFAAFGAHPRADIKCERLTFKAFEQFSGRTRLLADGGADAPIARLADGAIRPSGTPYTGLPSRQFWRKAVASMPSSDVDPVHDEGVRIDKETRVAAAGSCFAQHIAATLRERGYNFFVSETTGSDSTDPASNVHEVFSARFGNIYSSRQLLQLFQRAYGDFVPLERAWQRDDGRFVDPFRPRVVDRGFASEADVLIERERHLLAVRSMFEGLDVFVFTLGLTEAWRSIADGAVFPLAPGVAGGEADLSRYEFVNFTVAEVTADLDRFLDLLGAVNPGARVILTVSPVPLVATYEDEHVLVATTYSKSVLRVAARQACRIHPRCVYFPSYELITGNFSRGAYFESDLRSITRAGVEHVMRLFFKHYASSHDGDETDSDVDREMRAIGQLICDEDALDPLAPAMSDADRERVA